MELEDMQPLIATRSELVNFLICLQDDLSSGQAWENDSLQSFLAAMAAYLDDADLGDECSWRAFAKVLLAARVYE